MEKKLMMMVVATLAASFGARAATETVGGYTWAYINGDTVEIDRCIHSVAGGNTIE